MSEGKSFHIHARATAKDDKTATSETDNRHYIPRVYRSWSFYDK